MRSTTPSKYVTWLALALLALAHGALGQETAAELRITRVTPGGTNVPAGRQLVIQFNRPVVPIGRMERAAAELPISISPALDCQWRWIDPSALACQLGQAQAFRLATRYSVTIDPGIRAEDGGTIAATYRHSFFTQRPRVQLATFSTWRGPGTPVIRIVFDQPVAASSVREHLFVSSEQGERQTLAVEPDREDRTLPRFLPLAGEPLLADFGATQSASSDARTTEIDGEEARRVWLLSPVAPLPLDSRVELRVEPGLRSPGGPATGDERRVVVQFDTFPEYRLLGIHCRGNDRRAIFIENAPPATGDDAAPGAGAEIEAEAARLCSPLLGIGLAFSAPTLNSEVRDHVQIVPDLAGGRTDYDPWENAGEFSRLSAPHRRDRRYIVWFPERLQADRVYSVASSGVAETPRDEFGRELAAPISLSFKTDHRPPNLLVTHATAVIESDVDTEVPLYVTNLDSATLDYRRLTAAGSDAGSSTTPVLPEVEDIQYAVPLGVRSLLDGRSGAIYGRVSTEPYVAGAAQQTLFAQVTPYQVHVKFGHFDSLVWVTDLATGEPVTDAVVSIYIDRLTELSDSYEPLAETRTDAAGLATFGGALELDGDLSLFGYRCDNGYRDDCPRLFVRVQRDDDFALLPLDQRFEVSAARASSYTVSNGHQPEFGHLQSWGTTAQGVYRAGDTIEFKVYVRDQTNERYSAAPTGPYSLEILDPTGKSVYSNENVELSEFGAFHGRHELPQSASVGWYQFRLTAGFAEQVRLPMRVLVTDFTPASFRVSTRLNGDSYVAGAEVTAEARASLFSGGPYTNAEARLTATLTGRPFRSTHPLAASFSFDNSNAARNVDISQYVGRVGTEGELAHRFRLPDDLGAQIVYGVLNVEGAVRDDRGRYVANGAAARFLAVDRLVGLQNTGWIYVEDEPAEIQFVVVDADGNPAAGTAVHVAVERLQTRAARVKGAGNAYLTELVNEWVGVAACDATSETTPGSCRFVPDGPGRYRATARIEDARGRPHETQIPAWVRGKGQVVWNTGNDDRLVIVPEQTDYRIGDTARYLIQNPYPGARALVTIERYGILRQWVQTLEDSTPVLEIEIEPDFIPGFYLSVLLMSPRVAAPLPEFGEVDMGKPAFKMGYVGVPVVDPYKQIDIDVAVENEKYRPRDTVRVDIDARPLNPDGREPIEAAVVVLDEAVLDLIQDGTAYFDPYRGFNKLDGLDVRNFGLLTRLVGRQRIDLKGANPGGDGGTALSMRTLFEYVGYWNPSLELDARGRGEFEFEVPDNLTGWRVLVLATTPTDRMGLGEAQFTVNLPTEIRPVMPNQVTEGDRFEAGFSVTNRTDQAREIDVRIAAEGDAVAAEQETRLRLAPYERGTVLMPVDAARLAPNRDQQRGAIRFTATARDAVDGDMLRHDVPVNKQRSLQTAASYGSLVGTTATESLLFPQNIHTDVGEVGVDLSASVISNLDGAFRYLRDYDYVCWEQKLTKAVMASHYRNLEAYLDDEFEWPDSARLPAQMLAQAASYQAPSGGMAYFVPRDEYVSPYLSAYTALAFNWLRRAGHTIPEAVEARLHDYLDTLLKRDVAPDFYSRGMASTVRAVALAALAEHGKVGLDDLQRYRGHVEYMSLFGKAHYLQAATSLADETTAREVGEIVMQNAVRSAGKVTFNESLDDGYHRILTTPLRANCAILSALAADPGADDPDGRFELVRAIAQSRGNRDHWENTQENMFCMNALIDYARRYEAAAPDLQANVELDGRALGGATFDSVRDRAVSRVRPIGDDDPGRASRMVVRRSGEGRLYYAARMSYAYTDEASERVNAGIDVRREYSVQRDGEWVLLDNPARIARGELVRVDIYVSLPTARNFVVVDDPIPGGLEPVNRDLANASRVDADAGDFVAANGAWWFQYADWSHYGTSRWSFHHRELRHDAARFYSDYLPAGNYHLSYTAQAIAAGEFKRMPVRAEEMYDPDVYGIGLPGMLTVTAP